MRIQQTSSNGRRCRQEIAVQSLQSHSIHGSSIDRASPQSIWNSPTTSGVLHTQHNKRKPETPTTNQPHQDYALLKVSDNEASVELSFSTSPNAFAPSVQILLSADTPEWRDSKCEFSKNTTNRAQLCRQGKHSYHSYHTRYIHVVIAGLHNPL
jgi:hypothetical protein